MRTLPAGLVTIVLTAFAVAQKPVEKAAPPPPPVLGKAATETLVHAFQTAEHWTMKAITLLSFGVDWHPAGAEAVIAALQAKDPRLRAFGIEVLRRADAHALPRVGTKALVTELIERLEEKNELVRERVFSVLKRILPEAAGRNGPKPRAWQAWWREASETYAPPAWEPPEPVKGGSGTVVGSLVDRAFDLRDAGLEVAIIVDSTGSMQVAIDTARDAIGDIVALLSGIAPDFKLGLVHYRDYGDMADGADVLVPLTKNEKQVRSRLAKLRAGGGGDVAERVDEGIKAALSRKMRWSRDANRLLIVIGDAPPHPETQTALLEVVKQAYENPFALGNKPITGKKKEKLRPFIISTIATHKQAKVWFDEIAAAGGGVSVLLPLAEQGKDEAVQEVVGHILVLSFGAKYEPQLRAFADIFFEYRAAGAFGKR